MPVTIATARYIPARLEEYQGNPLAEALPERLTGDELVAYLARLPDFDESQREWCDHDRELAVKRLRRCVIPTEAYQKFYSAFYLLLVSGYLHRTPFSVDTVRWMYDLALNEPVDEQTTADTLLVMGLSGSGKSTMLNAVLSLFPQVIEHTSYYDRPLRQKQIVYIRFDMPNDASRRALCKAFFRGIDEAVGTDYYKQYSGNRIPIETLQDQIKTICAAYYVGVIIIDEFQNLNVAKAGGKEVILQFFVSLTNKAQVPIIKCGTHSALRLFKGNFASGRREGSSGVFELLQLKPDDTEWLALTEIFWNAQWVKKPKPITDEMRERLYQLTQGIPDCLARLMVSANHEAISSGRETIDKTLLLKVYKQQFGLIRHALSALRKNNVGAYEDLKSADDWIESRGTKGSISQLVNLAKTQNFTGAAAAELKQHVIDSTIEYELSNTDKGKLHQLKSLLESAIEQGNGPQVLDHKSEKDNG